MKIKSIQIFLLLIAVLVFIILISKPLFIISEGKQAVITRFGQIVRVETEAGLKFKIPFIEKIRRYSKKILSWDGDPRRIPTIEQQFIWVDTTARWRIVDPTLFYSSINTMTQAYSRLDDIIDSAVRTTISKNKLVEAVRNTNSIRDVQPDAAASVTTDNTVSGEQQGIADLTSLTQQRVEQPKIEKGRRSLSQDMLKAVQELTPAFGIKIIDVVIRQIRYSDDLTESVYNRMISERKQIAQASRSWGEGRKQKILGQLENEKKSILSAAYAKSEEIKGRADAQASRIYANSYSQNPDFYEFWKAIESYKKTIPKLDKVLSTDYEYFQYLYNSRGR